MMYYYLPVNKEMHVIFFSDNAVFLPITKFFHRVLEVQFSSYK